MPYDTLRMLDDPHDLRRHLDLKAERKRIDAAIKALQPTIYSALLDEDGSAFDKAGPDGSPLTLAVRTRRSYEYGPAVDGLAAELKALEAYEERAGIAACTRATGYGTVMKVPPRPVDDGTAPQPLRLAT